MYNSYAARRLVNLINRLYPLKKCEGLPKKECLYYHIGECLGYCSKKLDKDKVDQMEHDILSFLRGNDKILKDKIMDKIKNYSDNLNFVAINNTSMPIVNRRVEFENINGKNIIDTETNRYIPERNQNGHLKFEETTIEDNRNET